jgi:hypothetical protein
MSKNKSVTARIPMFDWERGKSAIDAYDKGNKMPRRTSDSEIIRILFSIGTTEFMKITKQGVYRGRGK